MDRHTLGRRGEAAARRYLEREGMTILHQNWRCRMGEIDIIALDGKALVVCEVKTRRSQSAGSPEEAVTHAKQRRLVRLADMYRMCAARDLPHLVRFDVVTVTSRGDGSALLRHHREAFGADGIAER